MHKECKVFPEINVHRTTVKNTARDVRLEIPNEFPERQKENRIFSLLQNLQAVPYCLVAEYNANLTKLDSIFLAGCNAMAKFDMLEAVKHFC